MTYFDFMPSSKAAFQFKPTLAGDVYVAYVRWNLFGRRWYLQLYDQTNVLVLSCPLIGSGPLVGIVSASWDAATGTARLFVPSHGYKLGEVVELTVSNLGDGYDGTFEMLARTSDMLSYSIMSDPGAASSIGSISFDVNLIEGYIDDASLVFRTDTSRIEVA